MYILKSKSFSVFCCLAVKIRSLSSSSSLSELSWRPSLFLRLELLESRDCRIGALHGDINYNYVITNFRDTGFSLYVT